jgi:hypothetical protein
VSTLSRSGAWASRAVGASLMPKRFRTVAMIAVWSNGTGLDLPKIVPGHVGRHDDCRHAYAIAVEAEDLSGRGRFGRHRGRWRHVIVATAMFVISDNQQSFAPNLTGPQTVVDVGDQLLAERDNRWRVLIVFRVAEIRKVLRLDERIGGQLSSLAVGLKLPIGVEVAAQEEQLQQRVRLGNVVKIDLPTIDAGLLQAIEDGRHIGKVRRIIVLMAPKRTNDHRPRIFERAATAPAPERARSNASRFSDRRFVAGLIAVGPDNFGQSRPIGVLFGTVQAFESIGLWIERAEQAIERAVLQHEHDDVVDFLQ